MIAIILVTLSSGLACLFFYMIGRRQWGLVPLLFLIFFITNTISVDQEQDQSLKEVLEKYWLMISRAVTMAGLAGIWLYFHINSYQVLSSLMALNIVLMIWSYIQNYKDGLKMFQISMRILLAIISTIGFSHSTHIGRVTIRWLIAMIMAVYAFTYFVLKPFISVQSNSIKEMLIFTTHTTILIMLISSPHQLFYGLFLAQCYLLLIFSGIAYIKDFETKTKKQATIDAADIIAGQKVLEHKTIKLALWQKELINITDSMSSYTQMAMSILNVVVMIAIMSSFFTNVGQQDVRRVTQLLYRASVAIFIYNFFTIKKINLYYNIQRVFVFFIINFAIYLSLISVFHSSIEQITVRAILRNIANSIIIFYSDELLQKGVLKHDDYYYWIVANILAMVVNIILINRIESIPGQLSFALITMYIGIQWFLMYYNLHHIKQYQ